MKSSKDRAIVAQVAFKGAIDLAVAGKIDIKSVLDATDAYAEHLWDKYGFENSYESYPSKSQSSGNSDPTDKQLNFIKKLLKEVPKSVSDSAQTQVDNGLTGLGASQLIKSLLEEKENNEPVAKEPANEFESPF
mgnify:CR=1 FL=1|jgi:hypothetical protein|tara:strand:+ start:1535 stop:1936 length:402 start_codon:yes stop_codon:yes gene_type:complete